MRYLMEGKLSRKECEDFTKKWFEIKGAPEKQMDAVDKRRAFDELYDEATGIVFDFDNVKTTKGYDDIKKYMRKAWLKLGFEAADGTEKNINVALQILENTPIQNSSSYANIFDYVINNYDKLPDLDGKYNQSIAMRTVLENIPGIWTYSHNDITNALKALSSLVKKYKIDDNKKLYDIIYEDGELVNLREWPKRFDYDPQKEKEDNKERERAKKKQSIAAKNARAQRRHRPN